ncbi:hypothetical protein [uncultured phage MedDCM-OCT-S08-C232]|nr:hypothetical protein [uncultured phage MedDCM-OCT-S08-C232]
MSEIKVNSIKGVGASSAAITVNNTDGTCTANITSIGSSQLSNRNKIINGSMICSQRGTSETGVNSSGYKTHLIVGLIKLLAVKVHILYRSQPILLMVC